MNKKIGKIGEQYAADYLWSKGYEVLGQNYFSRYGEIDIIAQYKDVLVFVEVKARTSGSFGLPEESVGRTKLRKMKKTIMKYLIENRFYGYWRIDVIAIQLKSFDELRDLRHYMNVQLF